MDHRETGIYYGDYLQLDKILNAQDLESVKAGKPAHDEMLFIITHQTYELWFRQILHELDSMLHLFGQPEIRDNSPDFYTIFHRLSRVKVILQLLIKQIDIMETMTPLDFLDFRNLLRPASGFQSVQFKLVEAALGLKQADRHGELYYVSQLRPAHVAEIQFREDRHSLLELTNVWLERMPFFKDATCWEGFSSNFLPNQQMHPFWSAYVSCYSESLLANEQGNLRQFEDFFWGEPSADNKLSFEARRSALFIMLYRDYPLLHLPFQYLTLLLDMDELMSTWRFRHMNMVNRIIGLRSGTGGSSGKDYLRAALDRHYIFKDIAALTTFLIERSNLPTLPEKLQQRLGFVAVTHT
jgi:tryptophan 2,3-dioxygenase